MRLRDNYLLIIMARDVILIKVTQDFLKRAEWCIIVSVGGRRRNFLSTHVPRGWRARRFSRMTHRTDRGLVVFRVALELLSLALLLRGTPETLLAPTRKRKVSALCSLIATITPISPQFRSIIFHFCTVEFVTFFTQSKIILIQVIINNIIIKYSLGGKNSKNVIKSIFLNYSYEICFTRNILL